MKIVFFGTPYYVVPILKSIHKEFVTGPGKSPIAAVVTQPPRPTGRKQIPSYSPIDKWAHEHKIPTFYQASDLKKEKIVADFGVLASYGEIIPIDIINLFPKGILVIHPSLLPKYRGASPVPAAILAGNTVTGVTILKMDSKVDHGPIVSQFKEDILPNDTGDTLRDRLFEKSAQVLVELIEPFTKNKITPRGQDDSAATFTHIIKKEDGKVDLNSDDPDLIERKLRAYSPWPGIWTVLPTGKRLKILKGHIENGKYIPDEVQLEGKTPVTWKQFLEGHSLT